MERQKSTWKTIREQANVSRKQLAENLKCSVSALWHFENGDRPMPPRFQIEYLKLRNTDADKIIIEYLEEFIRR